MKALSSHKAMRKLIVVARLAGVTAILLPGHLLGQGVPQGGAGGEVDTPLPPGAADALEQRMQMRRDTQIAGQPQPELPALPVGGRAGRAGTGGFGGSAGAPGGGGGVAPFTIAQPQPVIDKKLTPVFTGADPALVEVSDKWITQVIPLKSITGIRVRQELVPFFSADADISFSASANCLVMTDTAAHVHHMLEIIAALEKASAERPATAQSAPLPMPSAIPVPAAAQDGVLHVTGTIRSEFAQIPALRDGIISEVLVPLRQSVSKGEIMFRYDSRQLETDIAETAARLEASHAALAAMPAGTAPRDVDVRKAEIALEQASLNARKAELQEMDIRSPVTGTTMSGEAIYGNLHPGMYVLRGTILATVVNTTDFEVTFRVLAKDLPALRVKQKLTFTSGVFPDATYSGEITFIAPTLETISNV
ncbi:MAG TPA: efflux RND transporter periplasmic adaptor subunit, partial [Phycisphaerae bacterium]